MVRAASGIAVATAVAAARPGVMPAAMLAVAALVVVPLAAGGSRGVTAAGAALVVSLLLPRGPSAAALATLWLAWCALYALRLRSVPSAYLVVGAGWAVLDRLGADPASVGATIVELTAVHFHYAGFAAGTLAGAAWERNRAPIAVPLLVLAGPPLIAAGFSVWIGFQLAGTAVLTAGMLGVAWWTRRDPSPWVRAAGLCVVLGMALALAFAAGNVFGWVVLPIDVMARTHGLLNGAGFAVAGLAGRALAAAPAVSPAGAPPAAGVVSRARAG